MFNKIKITFGAPSGTFDINTRNMTFSLDQAPLVGISLPLDVLEPYKEKTLARMKEVFAAKKCESGRFSTGGGYSDFELPSGLPIEGRFVIQIFATPLEPKLAYATITIVRLRLIPFDPAAHNVVRRGLPT
jgi:hypothetical protein